MNDQTDNTMSDLISRQAAIDVLWKALFSYEEKEEERFQKSEELDVGDWFLHRIFVQNMNDIDRQAIRELPSAQPEIIHCGNCKHHSDEESGMVYCPEIIGGWVKNDYFCTIWEGERDG